MHRSGEMIEKFMAVSFLRSNPTGESGFHRYLRAFGRQHLFECVADSVDHGTTCGQLATIERKTVMKSAVKFFARRKRHILQVHGEELAGRRQREEQRLAVGGELDLFKEAGITRAACHALSLRSS